MTNFKNGVGGNLKLIRKAKGITQEELAEIIGIHSRQLSKIETGEHFPSCKTLEKLCLALCISPRDLFDFEIMESEAIRTGTDNRVHVKATKSGNVYKLHPDDKNKIEVDKECTDKSMLNAAKVLNRPIITEYHDPDNKKTSKIVAFYPDGTERILKNSVDVEYERNINFMMSEFKKAAKDKVAMNYIKLALTALKSDEDLKKLEGAIYGMKLSRGID